jgi:hypothetical protein
MPDARHDYLLTMRRELYQARLQCLYPSLLETSEIFRAESASESIILLSSGDYHGKRVCER